MIREYRGQDIETGEWRYGYYVCHQSHVGENELIHKIICNNEMSQQHKVFPESVGEFTGLKKIKRMVFTGDIVVHHRNEWSGKYTATGAKHYEKVSSVHEVYFDTEMLEFGLKNSSALFHCQFANEFEIIGNITDNPELLNE